MEGEAITSLMSVRHNAEAKRLGAILAAYETVCAYSCHRGSWQTLAAELAIYLDSEYFTKSEVKPPLHFRSEIPLEVYLEHLSYEDLAYLISDAITALFQRREVFAPWQHLECDVTTLFIDVVTWKRDQVSERQMLVRRCLVTLEDNDLHLLLYGLRREIIARNYLIDLRQSHSIADTWTPTSSSHLGILPRLKLEISIPDEAFLKVAVAYVTPSLEMTSSSAATFFQRASSRASAFLSSQRRNQGQGGRSPSLVPIMEDRPTSMPNRSAVDITGRSKRETQRSSFSDYGSFFTAFTHRTGSFEHRSITTRGSRLSTATIDNTEKRSTMQTFVSFPTVGLHTDTMADLSQWSETLKQKDIIPDPELENWSSGRGQHAEYQSYERNLIPLSVEQVLGKGTTAVVDSVHCMRVKLVRKVVCCNKKTRLKREDALQEVQQLYRAQHSHIVRLVGTYVIDDELAILTYPCAEWNLEQFLAIAPTASVLSERTQTISKFYTCLAKSLDFIHSFPIKHMDIKPQNILVRNIRHTIINDTDPFKIYITDFGSSRFYPSIEATETDSFTPFTRMYAAQEVVLQDTRGLSADVFSMGCVYAEMLAVVLDGLTDRYSLPQETPSHWDELKKARSGTNGTPRPYHLKVKDVSEWLHNLSIAQTELNAVREWTLMMLDNEQTQRPSAREIAEDPALPSACRSCILRSGPEKFEATRSSEIEPTAQPPLRDSL